MIPLMESTDPSRIAALRSNAEQWYKATARQRRRMIREATNTALYVRLAIDRRKNVTHRACLMSPSGAKRREASQVLAP